jgi:hypothetical protein
MRRKSWTFGYKGEDLSVAARRKEGFHRERLEAWKKVKDKTMESIREDGLCIGEGPAAGFRRTKRRDWDDAQVTVREDLSRRLDQCLEKLGHHTGMADSYAGWLQVLEAVPEARLELDHDDWLYFFGRADQS